MCGSISSFSFVFFDPKNEKRLLMQSEHATSDGFFFDLRIRWPKWSDFGPTSDDLGHQIFKSKNGMVSLNSRSCPRQQAAAERSMSSMATQLYSDGASRPTRGRRAARLSMARLQSTGAGSGQATKRSALDAHLSVETHS